MEEEQTTPVESSPDSQPGEAADTTPQETAVIEEDYQLPDNFTEMMDAELGVIPDPPEPDQETAQGAETQTEDVVEPDTETVDTPSANRYEGEANVFGEVRTVNLEGDELQAVIQKGLAYDHDRKGIQVKIDEAVAEERERITAEFAAKSPSIDSEQYSKLQAFNDVASIVFEARPDLAEEYREAVQENRGLISKMLARGKSNTPAKGNRATSEIDDLRAEVQAMKDERAQEAERKKAEQQFVNAAAAFRKKHPKVDIERVARTVLRTGLSFDDAYALERGKAGTNPKDATEAAREVAKGVKRNPAVPSFPAGQGTAPGPVEMPKAGAPPDEVRQAHIKRLAETYGPDGLKAEIEGLRK